MQVPNITSMYRWVNTFFSSVNNQSQDFLQIVRASDGTILGWIDEAGKLQGSLALSVPEEDADPASIWLEDDFMSQTGASLGSPLGLGSLNWIPGLFGLATANISTSAFPNAGSASLSGSTEAGAGVTLALAVNPVPGFTLTLNTGWEANFVFQWGLTGSFQQKRMYLGFAVDGNSGSTGTYFAYGRPSKFIGLRYDTDPGNPTFALTAVENASEGSTIYKMTALQSEDANANQYAGQTFVVAGYSNPDNNGTFLCTASAGGATPTLTLNNPNGVAVTAAGTATIETPAISDTTYHFECVQNALQNSNIQGATYNTGIAPDNNWHRFRMRSIVQGEILFSIDGGTETMISMGAGTDTTSGTDLVIFDEGTYGLLESFYYAAGTCPGTNVIVSGATHPGNNGTFPILSMTESGEVAIHAATSSATFEANNSNLTFTWYNMFAPVIIFGNDSASSPASANLNVDYFSFVYSPRLALDFNGTSNSALPRYFPGQV